MSVISLVWQAEAWSRSGPIVTATAGWEDGFVLRSAPIITAINPGRSAITLISVRVLTAGSPSPKIWDLSKEPDKLPYRLKGGDSVSLRLDEIPKFWTASRKSQNIQFVIILGNGAKTTTNVLRIGGFENGS
jgi:hypothetical protein